MESTEGAREAYLDYLRTNPGKTMEKNKEASPTLSTATNRELLQEVLLRCPHLDLKRGKGGMDYLRDCTESVVLGHGFLGLIGPEGEV